MIHSRLNDSEFQVKHETGQHDKLAVMISAFFGRLKCFTHTQTNKSKTKKE